MENYPAIYKDPYETPGPQMLSAGTMELGYFGHVVAGVLMNGDALATAVGLSEGTLQSSDAGWEKFAVDGKILFVATRTIRRALSWNNINAAGAVTGTATVNINGKTYKVRLLTGGTTNPSSGGDGGEWNSLMYALHQDQAPPWASYSDLDLLTTSSAGYGSRSWCQEAITRGGVDGVTGWASASPAGASTDTGWRPV
ncbi:MAG: hypothetical protein M0P69_11875, partial [Bacteroidales bacterium]|nr:hypothetical protein [Bacteroidales bacterium]